MPLAPFPLPSPLAQAGSLFRGRWRGQASGPCASFPFLVIKNQIILFCLPSSQRLGNILESLEKDIKERTRLIQRNIQKREPWEGTISPL